MGTAFNSGHYSGNTNHSSPISHLQYGEFFSRFTAGEYAYPAYYSSDYACWLYCHTCRLYISDYCFAILLCRTLTLGMDPWCFALSGQSFFCIRYYSTHVLVAGCSGLSRDDYFCLAFEKFCSTFCQLRFAKKASIYFFFSPGV
ncbi:MAG: hypothetical protein UV94_C0006G0028 [Parcubacteria group bacterium GW2011_GWC1_43_30]|nr:MAG: hypothetical protein UV94_C0006G0028 [Parcubacteria group bacterium GW2011_GWC1_43_30]